MPALVVAGDARPTISTTAAGRDTPGIVVQLNRIPGVSRTVRGDTTTVSEDVSIRFDDPDLAIPWPDPTGLISDADRAAGTLADALDRLVGS